MKWILDRSLSISLAEQIRGQIIFAISYGELKPGDALPSVRKLARGLNVSPVTIAKVYQELAREGLAVSKPCVGSFIAPLAPGAGPAELQFSQKNLMQMAEHWLRQALLLGHSPGEIRQAFNQVVDQHTRREEVRPLAFVGRFAAATASYCAEIERQLADLNVRVVPALLSDLRADPRAAAGQFAGVKWVVTFAQQLQEVRALLDPERFQVALLEFTLSPPTRARLEALPAERRVAMISTLPEYAQTMKKELAGLGLIVPARLCALCGQAERVRRILGEADVVVYASGSEAALAGLPAGVEAVELLHAPDPRSISRLRALLV